MPADTISGFSSGTGFAGISGTLCSITASSLNINFKYVCLAMTPLYIIYLFSFYWIVDLKVKIDKKFAGEGNDLNLNSE